MLFRSKKLNKKFSNKLILKNNNLEIIENNITSIIGPNGSGKTTLIKCIVGDYSYEGSVSVLGTSNNPTPLLSKDIVYIPDNDKLDMEITAYQFIKLFAQLFDDYNHLKFEKKLKYFSGIYQMQNYLHARVDKFSHGMLKKTMLISSFVINKRYYFFDEPFNGLDFEYQLVTKKIISDLKKSNKTVVLTSHNLKYVQDISDQVVVMINGEIKYNDSIANIYKEYLTTDLEDIFIQMIEINKLIPYDHEITMSHFTD